MASPVHSGYPDRQVIEDLLIEAAREELLPRFAQVTRGHKADGSIVTAADLTMQARLREALATRWPDYGFLGEEMDEAGQRAALQHPDRPTWCLDPLDGTTNFAAGIPYFCVSLALLHHGRSVLGVVHDPLHGETFSAVRGQGAWLNGESLSPRDPGMPLCQCVAALDLKRLQPRLAERVLEERPFASQRSFGSVALEWCWLAAGRFRVYLHGGQKLWDYGAGVLILEEAGGISQTLAGEPVLRAAIEDRSVMAASDPALFKDWREWLGGP